MYRLGQKVIFVQDHLEQNLPTGDYGYIIAYDRSPDHVFDYVVRIPKTNRNVYVLAKDIELEEVLLQEAADEVERQALIDYALATKNEELFHKVLNGDSPAPKEKESNSDAVQKDFIRQVHIKAWI
jgi:hypothetical protein